MSNAVATTETKPAPPPVGGVSVGEFVAKGKADEEKRAKEAKA